MEYNFVLPMLVNQLVNGVTLNFQEYSDEELLKLLTILNRYVKYNVGLFCFEESTLDNYRKMIDLLNADNYIYGKEVLKGYTRVLELGLILENDDLKKQYKNDFISKQIELRKIENRDDIDSYLKECIRLDSILIQYINHNQIYYVKKNKEELEMIKSSIYYLSTCDALNKDLYEDFIDLYRESSIPLFDFEPCKILEFPVKKQGFIRALFKKR